eukprot:CAMPEP_0170760512 /NCGR_PEP_ID=MMETSP0733-20121128/1596_1 /TAXON_ID=186038 /ORGANISM="Fragilariopsis kerguelensis, Strain L26-C5" /LENGTH=110 /DNA_ID=CAMNT_0011100271 /DNA_START=226 /DNA_END=558 /DNA_ORIENTATION=+
MKEHLKLGSWVRKQRVRCKEEKLSTKRVSLLNKIGFVWKDLNDSNWKEMYTRLQAYNKQHKSTSVSGRYREDQQLAKWVKTQRTFYKNKKLSVQRINDLEAIEFVWKCRG